jgi:predicted esterase
VALACGCSSASSNGTADNPDAGVPDAPDESDPPSLITRCGAPVPAGAVQAPAFPTYAGTCPALAAAPALTTIESMGNDRELMVVRPTTIAAGETLPVVFVWHWLGGDAADVYEKLELQNAVDLRRFIAVVPQAKGDIIFRWPFGVSQPAERLAEELRYFDDMLACVSQELAADKNCVSSMGISAGALMTAQLASRRSHVLSSFVSVSGGVGGLARDWVPALRPLPALVMWGGPEDMYPDDLPLEHFDEASVELEQGLTSGGHLVMECVHNCGHDLPPFDAPIAGAPSFDLIWSFVLDHPYWLPSATSIYQQSMPSAAPAWCAVGAGAATPRAEDAVCP